MYDQTGYNIYNYDPYDRKCGYETSSYIFAEYELYRFAMGHQNIHICTVMFDSPDASDKQSDYDRHKEVA